MGNIAGKTWIGLGRWFVFDWIFLSSRPNWSLFLISNIEVTEKPVISLTR